MRNETGRRVRIGVGRVLGAMALSILLLPVPSAAQGGMSDEEITEAIENEIRYDPAISPDDVEVHTAEGVVTLTGTAENLLTRERTERVAETVKGVRSVVNLIQIEPSEYRSDTSIRDDVEDALLLDPATDSYEIRPSVRDGAVTLRGSVESWAERDLAEKVAMGVPGVTGIRDEISVEPEVVRNDTEIERDIEEVLRWDVLVDHALVEVDVKGGDVELRGVVGSAAERRQAALDAWVAGVRSVDDTDLTVARWARDEDLRADKYQAVSDSGIEDALELALLYDPRVLGSNISVSSEDGIVTLQGMVQDLRAWRAAGDVARNTVGVSMVKNQLRIEPPNPPSDNRIADNIQDALQRNPYVDADGILVTVIDGTATLSGSVQSDFERAQADDAASGVLGVVEVENLLEVTGPARPLLYDPYVSTVNPQGLTWYRYEPSRPGTADDVIEAAIEREFFWSPFVDGSDIVVTVEDGVATLTGTVHSLRERQDATENAYEGGAIRVENDLIVDRSSGGSSPDLA